MRVVIQRVKEAAVRVEAQVVGQIAQGMLVFLGIARQDSLRDADYLVKKLSELRIFEDADGKMNLSAGQVGGAFLIVSQFTLYGNCDKGRRPSFDEAAEATQGQELYDYFVQQLQATGAQVQTGQFRAMMDVALINDGPVTFVVDSPKD